MLDLNDLRMFVQIVRGGGFIGASNSSGAPRSTLSHRLAKLEKSLNSQLLHRTSRQVQLTEAGRELLHHAGEVIERAELPEAAMRRQATSPCGTVRVTPAAATIQYAPRWL